MMNKYRDDNVWLRGDRFRDGQRATQQRVQRGGCRGVWGRWKDYVDTGHGGDVSLEALIKKDTNYAQNFSFSLLSIMSKNTHIVLHCDKCGRELWTTESTSEYLTLKCNCGGYFDKEVPIMCPNCGGEIDHPRPYVTEALVWNWCECSKALAVQ